MSPPDSSCPWLLLRAFRWFDEGLLAELNAAGWPEVGRPESMVFAHLDVDGTRISELARRAGVTRQAVHQVVQGLSRAGLVELTPDPDNRSAKLVRPTRRGQDSIDVAVRRLLRLEEVLAERIGGRRTSALREALSIDWGLVPEPTADDPSADGALEIDLVGRPDRGRL